MFEVNSVKNRMSTATIVIIKISGTPPTPDSISPIHKSTPVSTIEPASASPPPNSKSTPQGKSFATPQSRTRPFCFLDGMMNNRTAANIAIEPSPSNSVNAKRSKKNPLKIQSDAARINTASTHFSSLVIFPNFSNSSTIILRPPGNCFIPCLNWKKFM